MFTADFLIRKNNISNNNKSITAFEYNKKREVDNLLVALGKSQGISKVNE